MNRLLSSLLFIIVTPSLLVAEAKSQITVAVDRALHTTPITGRVIVVLSRSERPEPRFLAAPNSVPMFGADAEALAPGKSVVIGESSPAHSVESLKDLPPGDYYAQAILNVYTKFDRADGHTVWLPYNSAGRSFNTAPGNLYSDVKKVHVDPQNGFNTELVLNQRIPEPPQPEDTKWVKRLRIKNDLLSSFWGQPMYLGATVLLPKGYEDHPHVRYPVVYLQGWLGRPAFGFSENPSNSRGSAEANTESGYDFYKSWTSDDFPRFLAVTFTEPCPFFPDGYNVNSANNGPFGDAVTQELIPAVERQFRAIGKPYARLVEGASTGGWGSLNLQLKYPDYFGGAWVFNPDPIDFRKYQLIDIYNDDNAFTPPGRLWIPAERPFRRTTEGQVLWTIRQLSQFEAVLGSKGRSGYQLNAWEAIYGPVGDDGYPRPLWDKQTGKIDRTVAEYMRDNGYDLRHYAEKNWSTLGPKLAGKLHFINGEMDNFYLNLAVYEFEDFTKRAMNPRSDAKFVYGRPMKGHSWHEKNWAGLVREMAEHVRRHAPPGESIEWLGKGSG